MEIDVRVEDFLDDKLQSTADLEHLDTLLSSVEYQRSQLRAQLDDASRKLQETRRSVEDRQATLAAQIDEFQALQKSIDERLEHVALSDAASDAIRRLEPPMQQLRRLELAHRYLLLLQDVEKLGDAARSHLPKNPKAALEPYTRLKELSLRLKELQRQADGAAVHLVAHVEAATEALWGQMKKIMSEELDAVLSKRGWPTSDINTVVDDEWLQCFEKLLDLQLPEVLHASGPVSLLPVDVMAQILIKEFRFHFLSDKPTSSPDAFRTSVSRWFLSTLEEYGHFFQVKFGPVVFSKFADTAVADKMIYVDPGCALVTSMLPVMKEKVAATIAAREGDWAFFSDLMRELTAIDENIRPEGAGIGGDDPDREWGGLVSEVLRTHFRAWLAAEKKFALERFRAIMADPEARGIDANSAAAGWTKSTLAASRITDLLRNVTSTYSKIRRFSHRLRFLVDIQLDILDEYHDFLRGSLEAYVSITSTVGRAFGVTKEQLAALEGTGALETLCKVFCSANHIVDTLRKWSNEGFFVVFYDELQTRAKAVQDQSNLAGGISYEQVKDRTSATVGTEDGGIIFDETIAAYSQRRERAEEFITEAVVENQRKAFKAYLQRSQWSTIADESLLVDTTITAELDEPLRIIERDIDFLRKSLGTVVLRRVFRAAFDKLNSMLWTEVLMGHKFTASGAAQFARDVHAICSLMERYLRGSYGYLGSLSEAVRLLNLPVEAEASSENGQPLTLKMATDRVFTDNTEAKAVLDELEIASLTPANARQILQRRVENAE